MTAETIELTEQQLKDFIDTGNLILPLNVALRSQLSSRAEKITTLKDVRIYQFKKTCERVVEGSVTLTNTDHEMDIKCSKCGSQDFALTWKAHHRPYETTFGTTVPNNECMKCSCRTCGYKWQANPLDLDN